MILYKVTERKDHKFDYTCSDSDGKNIFPVGYCARYRDTFLQELGSDAYKDIDKHHTTGHATKQEAADCYKNYQLDHRLRLNVEHTNTQKKCDECGEWTNLGVMIGGWTKFNLCEKHNNRETVEKLYTINADELVWEG